MCIMYLGMSLFLAIVNEGSEPLLDIFTNDIIVIVQLMHVYSLDYNSTP